MLGTEHQLVSRQVGERQNHLIFELYFQTLILIYNCWHYTIASATLQLTIRKTQYLLDTPYNKKEPKNQSPIPYQSHLLYRSSSTGYRNLEGKLANPRDDVTPGTPEGIYTLKTTGDRRFFKTPKLNTYLCNRKLKYILSGPPTRVQSKWIEKSMACWIRTTDHI